MFGKNRFHPKNIYKNPPNFKELAIAYPEFRKYVRQELSGRYSIDYQDEKAVKELTKTLLKKDFNLDVDIDDKRLIPRVPLCLNYILWVEDLLDLLEPGVQRLGIDIGTGNVCIYSLLAAKRGWKMFATETDPENFKSAENNIIKNNLQDIVSLKLNQDPNKLLVGMLDEGVTYDFCMCNPPFYDYNEKPANRTFRRGFLNIKASDVSSEICTKGGEVSFIKQLINESVMLKTQIKIYTTLVGKKCDFLQLKKELQAVNPKSLTFSEFCQGRTIRWGLAWTFLDIPLKNVDHQLKNKAKKRKAHTPFTFSISDCDSSCSIKIFEKVKQFLTALNIQFKEVTDVYPAVTFKAVKNTWSHQRRKKRQEERRKDFSQGQEEEHMRQNFHPDDDNNDCSQAKKSKIDSHDSPNCDENIAVEGFIVLKMQDSPDSPCYAVLEMSWLSGNKESLHQIFQYFKNNWKDPI